VRVITAVGLVLSIALTSCGAPSPPVAWTARVALRSGELLTVSVDDPTTVVGAIAPATPQPGFNGARNQGLAFENPNGDPTLLLATWLGRGCLEAKVDLKVTRSETGYAISLHEVRTLQGCSSDVGTVKAIEMKLRTAIPAGSVTGELLEP
jgi:hypothetical protein